MGLANFIRDYIPHFATHATPLYSLLKKDTPFSWTPTHHKAFTHLQTAATTAPVLTLPIPNHPYTLQTDASLVASGAVLLQDQGAGKKVVGYASKTFSSREQSYSAYDREALALIHALRKFRCYLVGQPCTFQTDQQDLQKLLTQPTLNPRQINWVNEFAEFDCLIHYIKGINNVVADALSRQQLHCMTHATLNATTSLQLPILKQLAEEQHHCLDCTAQEGRPNIVRRHHPTQTKGLLYHTYKVGRQTRHRLLAPSHLRATLLKDFHEACGHFSYDK